MLRYLLVLGVLLAVVPVGAMAAPTQRCETAVAAALSALTHQDFKSTTKDFDAGLLHTHDPDNLRLVWASIRQQDGDFRVRGASVWQTVEGRRYLFTVMTFAKGSLIAIDLCDKSGKIGFFEWGPASNAAAKIASARPSIYPDGVREQPTVVMSAWGPLPATLTLPKGDGPFAAVLLVAGAGKNDQDESIGPNKPFRDLALGLARAGIASLRYDKGITDYPSQAGLSAHLTIDDEVTDDALTGLNLLRGQKLVASDRIFLLGHSLGAMMAPRIAQRAPFLAGVIMTGAPSESILANGMQQTRYIAAVQHVPQATLQQQLQALRDEEALLAKSARKVPAGSFVGMPQSWWMSLQVYDPVAAARSLTVPMLILQGGADFQVAPQPNFTRWQKAFAHDPRVTLIEYSGLSHIFMPSGTPPSPADYAKPSHMDARVIGAIARWIDKQPSRH